MKQAPNNGPDEPLMPPTTPDPSNLEKVINTVRDMINGIGKLVSGIF